MSLRLPLLFFLLIALGACGEAPAPKCPPSTASAAPGAPGVPAAETTTTLDGYTFVRSGDDYIDPATTPGERASLTKWSNESWAALTAFFGAVKSARPAMVACNTDPCALRFAGPARRSRAAVDANRIIILGVGDLTKGTILHELVHVEIVRRMGPARPRLPTWFDEGVASYVGDNAPCPPGDKRALDDLRRLAEPRAWTGFTSTAGKITIAYCHVREEIAAWVAKRSKRALVEVIDGVTTGKSFDDLYGPLALALPRDRWSRTLDARFSLDENTGVDAADSGAGSHVASLQRGALWTSGRHGAGVKVKDGAFVRGDGFSAFAVPDSPFTIAMWVRPLANKKVLVHTAVNASGGNGWCLPLLGFDANGHLAAQINYGSDAKSFVSAIGPAPALNAWSHIATSWSADDGLRLYVNGALVASAVPRSAEEHHRDATAFPAYLFFGSDAGGQCWTQAVESGSFDGVLDEIRVYDYALDAAEITNAMKR